MIKKASLFLSLICLGLFSSTVFAAVVTKAGAHKGPQSGSQNKKLEDGFSLSITGSLRTDMLSGNNQFKDAYAFEGNITEIFSGMAGLTDQQRVVKAEAGIIPLKRANTMFAVNNSRLWLCAEKKQGLWNYSFNLIFSGDANSTQSIREAYIQIASEKLGTFVFGDTKGVEARVACGPSDIIPGTGGTDGNFLRFVNTTTYVFMGPSLVGDTGVATKAFYGTPVFGGFRLYAAYTPNTRHLGEANLDTAYVPLSAKNGLSSFDLKSWGLGADYVYKTEGFSLNLAFVTLRSNTRPEEPNQTYLERVPTRSYSYGIVMTMGPLALGAEYLKNGRSAVLSNNLEAITPTVNGETLETKRYLSSLAGKYWALNLGAVLTDGPTSFGVSYFKTQRRTGLCALTNENTSIAEGKALVFSLEQKLAPGLASYVETGIYNMKNPDWAYVGCVITGVIGKPFNAVPNNKATAVITGIKIQF